jgi:hypothetical protein
MKNTNKKKKLVKMNSRLIGLNPDLISQKKLSVAARLLAKRRWQLVKKKRRIGLGVQA